MTMDKVALVTGASRGIGAAIADKLASQGYITIGTATSEGGAAAITERLAAIGKGAGMVLDVASTDSIQACMKSIEEQYGAPSILVNNAGITKDTLMMRMKDEDWDQVIQTNLSSVFRMSKAVIKGMMKARWGRIVNISSVVASMGNAGQVNYAAAKAGIEGLTRSMAKELGSRNITVNAVAPGFIETDMTNELPEAQKEALLAAISLQRLGNPAEIAGVVDFLVSDAASYVTGETVNVNGGMYMC
ncbi:3-oxoacyl-ACP reductase [Hahella sp. CCB-MM4]|nr:3-oxoacyl-ACP reductase FabG [Hahella sp. CCB-MM4]OZG71299.1 3-oxoacyl-ACP reductase [Hahella sp. CCB-MM4]